MLFPNRQGRRRRLLQERRSLVQVAKIRAHQGVVGPGFAGLGVAVREIGEIERQPSHLLHGGDLAAEDAVHEHQPFESHHPAPGLFHPRRDGPHQRLHVHRRRTDPLVDAVEVFVIDVRRVVAGGLDDDRLEVGVAVRGPARNAGDTDAVPVFDKPGSFFPQLHFRPPNASIVTSSFSIDPPIPILLLLPPSLSLSVSVSPLHFLFSIFDVQPTLFLDVRYLVNKTVACNFLPSKLNL